MEKKGTKRKVNQNFCISVWDPTEAKSNSYLCCVSTGSWMLVVENHILLLVTTCILDLNPQH